MFKSNLNKISRERHNSEEQNNELQNIELLCDAQEAVIKSFNCHSSIWSVIKYNTIHRK